ncbi:MAG TPA: VOC family protein [Steroidobacteraceae bacterium]|nr:VOC family protein [Steroidobacteraceae bacterium]
MKPTPSDWPRMASAVVYQDAVAAIEWLCDAFGFEVRLKVQGDQGQIEHSELTYGEGLIMVAQETPESPRLWKRAMRSPKTMKGTTTQSIMFFVDDADALRACARPRSADLRRARHAWLRRRLLVGPQLWRRRSGRASVVGDPAAAQPDLSAARHQWIVPPKIT